MSTLIMMIVILIMMEMIMNEATDFISFYHIQGINSWSSQLDL